MAITIYWNLVYSFLIWIYFCSYGVNQTVTATTAGYFWYDYTQLSLRIDYLNPWADYFCFRYIFHNLLLTLSILPDAEMCTELFAPDALYINFPLDNYCCKCCAAADGSYVILFMLRMLYLETRLDYSR